MQSTTLLDKFLPEFQFSEEHAILIQAAPQRIFAAVKELTPDEFSPLVALMFSLRGLPARLFAKPEQQVGDFSEKKPFLDQMLERNFMSLGETQNREIVFGMIGQFWKLTPKPAKLKHPDQFIQFQQPDYAKVAANLLITQEAAGKIRCATVTRIQVHDPASRRKFAVYWMIISLGSALIRRLWLKAIKRKAEQAQE